MALSRSIARGLTGKTRVQDARLQRAALLGVTQPMLTNDTRAEMPIGCCDESRGKHTVLEARQ